MPEGSEFLWRGNEADGLGFRYAKASNGVHSLVKVAFHRDAFNRSTINEWMDAHDEIAIAEAAGIDGPVHVRIRESFDAAAALAKADVEPPRHNRDTHEVNGMLVCGWESLNGNNYRPSLREHHPQYDNTPFSLNHPEIGKAVDVQSRFGQVKSPYIDDAFGARGTLAYNPDHPFAKQFAWAVENQPSTICCSHRINAVGQKNKETGMFDVTAYERVFGVELVSDGGTTRGMFEGATEGRPTSVSIHHRPKESEVDLKDLTIETLRTARPDLIEGVEANLKAHADYKALLKERDDLKTEVAAINAKLTSYTEAEALEARKATLRERCEKAGMAPELVTETFVNVLAEIPEAADDRVQEAIEDRLKLSAKTSAPTSRARSAQEAAGDNDRRANTQGKDESGKDIDAKTFAEGLVS